MRALFLFGFHFLELIPWRNLCNRDSLCKVAAYFPTIVKLSSLRQRKMCCAIVFRCVVCVHGLLYHQTSSPISHMASAKIATIGTITTNSKTLLIITIPHQFWKATLQQSLALRPMSTRPRYRRILTYYSPKSSSILHTSWAALYVAYVPTYSPS